MYRFKNGLRGVLAHTNTNSMPVDCTDAANHELNSWNLSSYK
jgi:uncharacterized protein YkvS